MAIRTDYYLRMIEDFYSALVGYITGVKMESLAKRAELSFGAYQFLEIESSAIERLTVEEVIRHFEGRKDAVDRIELLAFSLFNHYQTIEGHKSMSILYLSMGLLNYVDTISSSYSVERKMLIELQYELLRKIEEHEEK